jgi:DivIVA domain-containing protein
MDRDEIERRDFPVGRRGYDQTAVDAHLRQVADELEAMRGRASAAPARAPLSAGTSDQVRQILEAAERSAAQMREDAGREASDHVSRVGEAADGMLAQLDALERELGALLGALRASGERLSDGLARLQADVGEVGGAEAGPVEPPVAPSARAPVAPPPAEPAAPSARAPVAPPPGEPAAPPARAPVAPPPAEPAAAPAIGPVAPPAPDPGAPPAAEEDFAAAAPAARRPRRRKPAAPAPPAPAGARNGDEAGARLTALNMALGGTPREETAAFLAEHFELADPEALLDDVYARAGG